MNQLVFSALMGVDDELVSVVFCLGGFFNSNGLAFGVESRRRIEMSIVCIEDLVKFANLHIKRVKGSQQVAPAMWSRWPFA